MNNVKYRKCVGIMLVNGDGLVFLASRKNHDNGTLQMPQGGIEYGEDPAQAAIRELHEEVGTSNVKLLSKINRWLFYDFPVSPIVYSGVEYKGQKQKWYLMQFLGSDDEINLDSISQAEFDSWKWINIAEVVTHAIEFKKSVYEEVVKEFTPTIKTLTKNV